MSRSLFRAIGASLVATLVLALSSGALAQELGGLTTQATTALTGWQTFFLAIGALIVILVVFCVGAAIMFRRGGMEGLWNVALGGFIMGNAVLIGTFLYGAAAATTGGGG